MSDVREVDLTALHEATEAALRLAVEEHAAGAALTFVMGWLMEISAEREEDDDE